MSRVRHTTLSDLATQLGLSVSTVSRALRDHPDISSATKARVQAMANRTNYQPNLIAQSLQNRKSNNIGVIVPEIRNTFFATVISGIEEVAYEAGYTIMVCQSADSYQRELLNSKALAANRVAGMLVSISQESANVEHLRNVMSQGIPLVLFDRVAEGLPASMVMVDDFQGACEAVSHLVSRGYQRIAHLGGNQILSVSRQRHAGYRQALANHGLQYNPDLVVFGGYHEEDGLRGAAQLLAVREKPDAVFCVNDPVAIGVFRYCEEHGMQIPRDLALVGFANNPNTALLRPRLTTVNQPAFEIGKKSAELLLTALNEDSWPWQPQTLVLPTTLVVRESS